MSRLHQTFVSLFCVVHGYGLTLNKDGTPLLDHTGAYIHTRELQQVPGDKSAGCKDQMARCVMECREPSWCSCDPCPDMRDSFCHTCHFVLDDPAAKLEKTMNRYNQFALKLNESETEESKRAQLLQAAQFLLLPTSSNPSDGSSSQTYMNKLLGSIEDSQREGMNLAVYTTHDSTKQTVNSEILKDSAQTPAVPKDINGADSMAELAASSQPVEMDVFHKSAMKLMSQHEATGTNAAGKDRKTSTTQPAQMDAQATHPRSPLTQEAEESDPIRKAAMKLVNSLG